VELLRTAAARAATLSARRNLRQDQVVHAVPARGPQRVRAGLGVELLVMASAVQVFDVQAGQCARRVEVVDPTEIRILGTKTKLLRTLVAAAGVESAAAGVRSFIPKWRAIQNKTANSYVLK